MESASNEFRCLKAVFALSMSLITGSVVLGSMLIGGNLSMLEASYISGAFVFFSFCFLVLSRKTRAVYAVMLPSLCASRGQTVIISLAFSLLINGPVQAILINMEEVTFLCKFSPFFKKILFFKDG